MANSTFTKEISDLICEELALGKSMRTVCAQDGFPEMRTVFRWLREREDFCQQYTRAKEEAAEAFAEDMIAIADDSEFDTVTRYNEKGREYLATDHDHINRSRLRVDTRKWIASKLKPKKYGDRIENRLADPDGNALKITVTGIRPTDDNT